jgi:DNA topoisomerase-3
MGDRNVALFRETFRLLSGQYPDYARLCDESVVGEGNTNIFNSAALEDHHALIPLRPLPGNAGAGERNVFDLVLKSFFTVCMKDHVYNKKRLVIYIGSYRLRTQINEILQNGFKEAAIGQAGDEDSVQEVKQFDEKTCKVIQLEIIRKETRPKQEFTVDTLLGFMENPHNGGEEKLIGLGTAATRAAVLKLLFDRDYIREERKKLYASRKGLFLLKRLQSNEYLNQIADISQTTEWEQQLIKNPREFEVAIAEYVKNCIAGAGRETYTAEPLGVCPRCGSGMAEGTKTYYCLGYRNDPPCPYSLFKTIAGARITADDMRLLLSHKSTPVKTCVSKSGKKFKASLYLEGDGTIAFRFDNHKKGGKSAVKQSVQGVPHGDTTA